MHWWWRIEVHQARLEVFTVTAGPVALQWLQFHKGYIVNDILWASSIGVATSIAAICLLRPFVKSTSINYPDLFADSLAPGCKALSSGMLTRTTLALIRFPINPWPLTRPGTSKLGRLGGTEASFFFFFNLFVFFAEHKHTAAKAVSFRGGRLSPSPPAVTKRWSDGECLKQAVHLALGCTCPFSTPAGPRPQLAHPPLLRRGNRCSAASLVQVFF